MANGPIRSLCLIIAFAGLLTAAHAQQKSRLTASDLKAIKEAALDGSLYESDDLTEK